MSFCTVSTVYTVIFLHSIFGLQFQRVDNYKCAINAEINIVETGNGDNLVTVSVENNDQFLKYYFFNIDNQIQSYDFESNQIKNLSSGSYYCLVVENSECHTKIEFEI